MYHGYSSRLPEAVLRAAGHWDARHHEAAGTADVEATTERGMTVAISREEGTPAGEIARALGERLDWPVFDHELLERIAAEMHVRVELVESVDERHQSWLLASIEALAPQRTVNENSYLRRLVETMCSLAGHGHCIIVGRGAAQVLPAATTLRVRVVAPHALRVQRVCRTLSLPKHKAERHITIRDRQRCSFIRDHFQRDPADVHQYDLLLNVERLTIDDCAWLMEQALEVRQAAGSAAAKEKSHSALAGT